MPTDPLAHNPSKSLSVLNVIKIFLPSIFLPVVFLKALFSVFYFSSCILPHSALLSLHFLLTITFTQMILNFFLVPSSQLWLKYRPLPDSSETDVLMDVCKTANLLILNSSKTEFLIIGLKQQLSKIDNSSLNTTHSARNLCFIFDENLTFSDQISSLS